MHTHPLSPERLAIFVPFSKLSEEHLILLCHRIEICQEPEGKEISPRGDNRSEELFLLSGRVTVFAEDGSEITLSAGDNRSRFSLLNLRPSPNLIVSQTETEFFLLDSDLLQTLQAESSNLSLPLTEILANDSSHPLVLQFYRSLIQNKLSLPSLPEVTQKVSQIIVDEELNVDHMASLIAADASLAARLIKVANSALYRAYGPISQLSEAIKRLGLNATRHLVLAFALQVQLQIPAANWVRKRQLRSWKESIQLAAICYVLAKKCTKIPPEEALLAGLLHNIGELPLVQFAAEYPELADDPDYLDQIMQEARGQAGAIILHRWNFPEALVTAVQHVDTWFYEPNSKDVTLTDILILARLHSMAMSERSPSAPSISQVPSYEKIAPGPLTSQQRLEILEDARDQISEIKSIFNR
ncbi:HDOD domain-containing protein [Oceanospirillum sp.]|uniref:HDOD domain-containing protein n=1 Tax=Oceanospirillum sp. TaxID=2021254 RepID=UPI003A91DFB1